MEENKEVVQKPENIFTGIKESFKNTKNIIITSSILVCATAIGVITGITFKSFSNYQTYFYVDENVEVDHFGNYSKKIKGTAGDAEIYKISGTEDGPNILVLGGTHPNEPSGQLTATLLLENIKVTRGNVYIVTETNKSAFTHSHPQEATSMYYHLKTKNGKTRTFKFGSRATNTNQQWPNPDVYVTQSGQKLSSNDTRNLNRSYPGKENGTYTEKVAYGITEFIKQHDIDVTVDLHEASPEYVTINAMVYHQAAVDLAAGSLFGLEPYGIKISLNESPKNLHGLSHRELGDYTDTLAVLCETSNASQGKIRGAFTEDLITSGKDKFYDKAEELGVLYAAPVSINERVARHTQSVMALIESYNDLIDFDGVNANVGKTPEIVQRRVAKGTFSVSNVPSYDEIMQNGVGYYLHDPK